MIIHADESSKRVAGESWHSDVPAIPEPPMGSILRIHTAARDAAATRCSPACTPPTTRCRTPMQRFLDGLTAVHDGAPYYRSVNARIGRDDGGKELSAGRAPGRPHHPESGRKAPLRQRDVHHAHRRPLAQESDAVLALAVRRTSAPGVPVPLHLAQELIAFWDNRCVQHMAIWDYWPRTRSGYRVTIRGDKPV